MAESRSTFRSAESVASEAHNAPASTTDGQPLSPDSARPRRGSFSFLRRSKSRESTSARVTSDASGSRKLSRRGRKEKAKADAASNAAPPQLPKPTLPQISAPFGNDIPHTSYPPPTSSSSAAPPGSRSGYDPNAFYRRHLMAEKKPSASEAPMNIPVPPLPSSPGVDTLPQESMANRGRYSYASSINSPGVSGARRIRRRKDPTPFNILVIGTAHSGKTSFIEFLRHALTRSARSRHTSTATASEPVSHSTKGHPFPSHYLETELEGERIGVTLWDSASLQKHIIDIQLREVTAFIEGKFQETFIEESKVLRSTNVRDTHIHCVLFVMNPQQLDMNIASAAPNARPSHYSNKPVRIQGGLDADFEGQVLRSLQGMTTVVPVISKADTITTAHMSYLKRLVWDSFKKLKIDPLEALNVDSDDDASAYETAVSDGEADDEDPLQAESISSKYDNAEETIDAKKGKFSEDDDGEKTPVKTKFTTPLPDLNKTPEKSKTPQHADVRVSAMSMNVDLPPLPLSIIAPDTYEPGTVGRRFPWGFADPYNADHCDFVKLMDNVFSEWRGELRTVARERWYENWRTNRLKTRAPSGNASNGRAYPPRPATYNQPQQRAVSSAAAYGGKPPEQTARLGSSHNAAAPATVTGNGSAPPPVPVPAIAPPAAPVSTADIGVAVSNGVGSAPPPAMPRAASYRGIGTY